MRIHRRLATLATAALLAACGGGGSDSPSPSATAEGFWVGPTSTGYTARLVVLETGESWGLYSTPTAIVGALYGNTASSNGSLNGTGSDFFFLTRQLLSASYSGTYTPKQTMRVTTSSGVTFTGAYAAEYDTPASLAAVAGTYTGVGITLASGAYAVPMTITAAGVVTTSTPQCSGTGTIQPRPTGKGVFNFTIAFTGASCPLAAAGTTSGVGYYDAAVRTLVTLGLNGTKTNGFFWQGSK